MSLRLKVVEMVVQRGCATEDHLMPHLPGYTRRQVRKALQNAAHLGFLWCEAAPKRGRRHDAARPSTYWPGRKEADPLASVLAPRKANAAPMVASVFELGNPRPKAAWPTFRGVVHRPLGNWHEEVAA